MYDLPSPVSLCVAHVRLRDLPQNQAPQAPLSGIGNALLCLELCLTGRKDIATASTTRHFEHERSVNIASFLSKRGNAHTAAQNAPQETNTVTKASIFTFSLAEMSSSA